MSTSAQLAAALDPVALQELCGYHCLPDGLEAAFHALCIVFGIPAAQAPDAAHKGKTHPDYYLGFKGRLPPAPAAPAGGARHREPISHRSSHPREPTGHDAFIAKMAAYDFASLTKEQFALLTPIVEHADFTVAFMKCRSSAGAAIVAWVLALYQQHKA